MFVLPLNCRQASIDFMVQASKCLGNIDSSVFLVPLLRDLLKHDIAGLQVNEDVLQCALVTKLRCASYL
jgi:hypothetical protein